MSRIKSLGPARPLLSRWGADPTSKCLALIRSDTHYPLPRKRAVSVRRIQGLRQVFKGTYYCSYGLSDHDYTSSRLEAATRPYQRPESFIVRFWLRKSV